MSLVRSMVVGLQSLFRKEQVSQELDEELNGFLEMAAEEKMKQGMSRKDALRAVRLERGNLEVTKEVVRSAGWESFVAALWQDLRFATRVLRKSPGFAAVAVLTLALGIGANTAMFTVVNGVILKPLPYPHPDRLVMLWERQLSDGTLGTVAPANFVDWREQNHSFDKMAAIDPYPDFILNGSGEPQRLTGAAVSSDFFSLLGVHMALGRDFLPEEDRPGHNQVAIVSYSTWLNYFGGRPDIVERQLTLNNTAYSVVGVLPRDFSLVSKASDFQSRNRFDLWTPLALASPPEPWQRGTHPLCVFARLKSGIPLEQAQTDLNQVAANLQHLYPADDKERGITAVPLGQHVVANLLTLLQFKQVSANDSLKQNGRGMAAGQSRLRSALIIGQVAVALVLLVGAGLMIKSLWMLLKVSPGFPTEHILTARLSLPPQYPNGNVFGIGQHRRISAFQWELLGRVRGIPGVQSAAFTAYLPLSGADSSWAFDIEGRAAKPLGVYDITNYRPVSANYFETVGIPVQRGRSFGPTDNEDSPLVVVVNESMARTYWNQQNPVDQRARFSDQKWRTIVGVVGDVRHEGLGMKPESEVYIPYGQIANVESRPTIVLRTSIEPTSLTSALRKAVSEVDENLPQDYIETMKQIVSVSVGQPRFRTAVLLIFAILALFVASIGLYGVMSYLISQRTREFGIRVAVGASSGALLRLVLGQAAKLVGIGICLGLVGAMLLARSIASLLYGVTPFDAATLASVSLLLAAVALLASYIPARRAASVDPMVALRYEE